MHNIFIAQAERKMPALDAQLNALMIICFVESLNIWKFSEIHFNCIEIQWFTFHKLHHAPKTFFAPRIVLHMNMHISEKYF